MYSPKVINRNIAAVESQTGLALREHTIVEVLEHTEHLNKLVEPALGGKLRLKRPLTEEENLFITNEQMMCKLSFPYWATRYAYIRHEKGGETLISFRESQEILLSRIGKIQETGKPILIINLKARQIYASTLSELILTHKATTTTGITSVLAADEPAQSDFLFNMMQRVYQHLPFYLKPHRKYEVKGTQMFFDELDSNILVDSGNKKGGGLGQGKAIHAGHLSELATWNDPDMVTADLIPAIISARSANTFFILESTAKGRSNRWHDWWFQAKDGAFFGFEPVFIPFYVLKEKYADDPPTLWQPSERSETFAKSLLVSKGVSLTKKQLYWWEQTYNSYKAGNKLNEFFAEYASDDEEAFQSTGKSVFPIEVVQDLRRKALTKSRTAYVFEERQLV